MTAHRSAPCCHLHQEVGCCDPNDCGPCCERCPTCPSIPPCGFCFEPLSGHTPEELVSCTLDLREVEEIDGGAGDDIVI